MTFGYLINTNQKIPAGKFDLIHYGIDSSNTDGSDTSFNVYLLSERSTDSNDIIDKTTQSATFGYTNVGVVSPTLTLTASFNNYNPQAKTFFDIGFQISQRGLYTTESIILDLTVIGNDNYNNRDYECLILNSNKDKSSDFLTIYFNTFSQIFIKAKNDILAFSQPYYFRCYHMINPIGVDSNGGLTITGLVVNSQNFAIISKVGVYVSKFNYTISFSYFEAFFKQKLLSFPGNSQDLQFTFASTLLNLTNSSRILVWFP